MKTAVKTDRLRQRFQMWDVDRNGRISRSDYEAEARRIIGAFGETPDSLRGAAVLDAYLRVHDFLAGRTGLGNRPMTEDQFVAVLENEMFRHGDAGFGKVLRPMVRAVVDLCDTDGDGQVNRAEFRQWLRALGLDQGRADEAFRLLDTDGDGALTADELMRAVKDYYYGDLDIPLFGSC